METIFSSVELNKIPFLALAASRLHCSLILPNLNVTCTLILSSLRVICYLSVTCTLILSDVRVLYYLEVTRDP